MIHVSNLSGGYDGKEIIRDVSFHVEKGKVLGILGPNGSGKSTLVKCISGILKPTAGTVEVDGQLLESYHSKELARKMAVLPQLHANAFSNTVYDTVSIGRYPYQSGLFSKWSQEDETAVQQAMQQTGVKEYAHIDLALLSGGEQQRVFIAQALAQQAEILLLDEPTNHLDIAHQKQILDVLKQEVATRELTVISIFHDINLASLYCDELLLLDHGKVYEIGAPHKVINECTIHDVYKADVYTYAHPTIPKPQITLMPTELKQSSYKVSAQDFYIEEYLVRLQTARPLKVISSAVHNAGLGWYSTFINRTVPPNLVIEDVNAEMAQYLYEQAYSPSSTVAMLTAVPGKHAIIRTLSDGPWEVTIMVTAGVANAVDVTQGYQHSTIPHVGTINTWIIVNGTMSEEAFLQAMMTATEAKTKALAHLQVKDSLTGTIATGTSTDSVLVAATQDGPAIQYAGTITEIGKLIGRGVYEVTVEAIQYHEQNKFKEEK